jgi:hypothetical protein
MHTAAVSLPAEIRDAQYAETVFLEPCILAPVPLDVSDDDVIGTSVKLQYELVLRPVAVKLPHAGELDIALRFWDLWV